MEMEVEMAMLLMGEENSLDTRITSLLKVPTYMGQMWHLKRTGDAETVVSHAFSSLA